MKETVDAIYENGVLRPLRKLAMAEGQRVRISMESKTAAEDREEKAYDFADLIGRLTWSGDALIEQKRIRDEWR